MKKQAFHTLLLAVFFVSSAGANNLPPLASFTDDVNRDFFFAGESVTFDGSSSIDQDEGGAYINYYRWRVDGVIVHQGSSASQYTTSFSLSAGQSSKTVQVSLEVRDDENTWTTSEGKMTKTYTIRRGQDRHFYLKDHLGSVRVTVDEEGEPLGYDDYYPYGLQMPTRSSNTSNPNDRYKFTGHERDTEAGLTFDYMGARTYDPLLGIFMQIDPLMEFSTPYSYVGANPVNLTDPTGMSSECARRGTGSVSIDGGVPVCGDLDYEVMEEGEIKKKESKNKEQPEPLPIKKINIHEATDQQVIDHVLNYLFYLESKGQREGNLNEIFDFTKKDDIGGISIGKGYQTGPIGGSFQGKDYSGVINISGKDYSVNMFLGFTNNKIEDSYYTGVNLDRNISLEGAIGSVSKGVTGENYQLLVGAPYPQNEYTPIRFIFKAQFPRDQLEAVFNKPQK